MKNNFLRNILFLAFGLIMIFLKILENPFESQNPGKIFSK